MSDNEIVEYVRLERRIAGIISKRILMDEVGAGRKWDDEIKVALEECLKKIE